MEDLLITYFCGIAVVSVFMGILGVSEAIRDKEFPLRLLTVIFLLSICWPVLLVIACFGIGNTPSCSND
jgi:hypothetical protein